jgi:hypothetical protein
LVRTIRRYLNMATHKRVVEVARKRRSPELQAIRVLVLPDEDPDVSFLDQDEFEDRKQAYGRGDFSFVGVRAEAEIVVDGILQTIVSGGLWGVESDAGDEYLREVADEEYNDLRRILKTLGVPTSELPNQVDPKWIEWRV